MESQFVVYSLFMSMHLILTNSGHAYRTKLTLFVLLPAHTFHYHSASGLSSPFLIAFSVQILAHSGKFYFPSIRYR